MKTCRTNSKSVRCLLTLLTLVLFSPAAWGGAPQAVSIQDAELSLPSLLPGSPFPTSSEMNQSENGKTGPQSPGNADPTSGSAARLTQQSPTEVFGGQSTIGSRQSAIYAPQADTAQSPESMFPSLFPRSSLATEREKGKRRSRQTAATQQAPIGDHQSTTDNRHGGQGGTDNRQSTIGNGFERPAFAIFPDELWGRTLEALGYQQAELRIPSFLPRSPLSRAEVRRYDGQSGIDSRQSAIDNPPPGGKSKGENWEMGRAQAIGPQLTVDTQQPDNRPAITDIGRNAIDNRQWAIDNGYDAGQTTDNGPSAAQVLMAANLTSHFPVQGYNGQRTTTNEPSAIGNLQSKIENGSSATTSRIGVGLRDPFKLPPPPRPALEESDSMVARNRPPGPRGLLIAHLKLKGIVRDSGTKKMIAVVINNSNRAYFLREGEEVYNGSVSKITPEAVYFKENFFDAQRGVHSREVVKILNPPAGEVR